MSETREPGFEQGFEPWAWLAFGVAGATGALFVFLGLRPGGSGPVLVYRFGLLAAGCASAAGMLIAVLFCLWRRPVLQRRRVWPLAALAASLWLCSMPIAYPSSHEGKFSPTRFRLPFEGAARVRHGGEQRDTNHLLFDPARRFGTVFEGSGGEGLRVVAPAAGTLVARAPGRIGDVLVLATGPGEYCVLEGLEPEPSALAPGATVVAGAPLGRASERLCAHLQDQPEPGRGEGIPMRYWSYLVDGREVEAGVPIPPQEVASGTAAAPTSLSVPPVAR